MDLENLGQANLPLELTKRADRQSGIALEVLNENMLYVSGLPTINQRRKLERFRRETVTIPFLSLDWEGREDSTTIPYVDCRRPDVPQYPLLLLAGVQLTALVIQIRKPQELPPEVRAILEVPGLTFLGKNVRKDCERLSHFSITLKQPTFVDTSLINPLLYLNKVYKNLAGVHPLDERGGDRTYQEGLGFLNFCVTNYDHKPQTREAYRRKYGTVPPFWPRHKVWHKMYLWGNVLKKYQLSYCYSDATVPLIACWELMRCYLDEDIGDKMQKTDIRRLFDRVTDLIHFGVTEYPGGEGVSAGATAIAVPAVARPPGDSEDEEEWSALDAALRIATFEDMNAQLGSYQRRIFTRLTLRKEDRYAVPRHLSDTTCFSKDDIRRWKRSKDTQKERRELNRKRHPEKEKLRKKNQKIAKRARERRENDDNQVAEGSMG